MYLSKGGHRRRLAHVCIVCGVLFSFAASGVFADEKKDKATAETTKAKSERGNKKKMKPHHMVHDFSGGEKWAKVFDDPERDGWQKPNDVVALIGLKPHMTVADIGAGTGYFAVRFAKVLQQGQVWGLDLAFDMVDYLNRRAVREQLPNLRAFSAQEKRVELPTPADVMFICNTYHHLTDRVSYLKHLATQFKTKDGELVIVDFKSGDIPVGPPEKHRISPAQLDKEAKQAGFVRQTLNETLLPYQYVAVYKRH